MAAFEYVIKKKRYDDEDAVLQTKKSTIVPENLIFEVFSWLPVKSVARFRCVSKLWYDLLKNNEYFHRNNLNHIDTNFTIIANPSTWEKPGFYTLDYPTKNIKEFSYPSGIKYDQIDRESATVDPSGIEYYQIDIEPSIRVVSSINGLLFLRYTLREDTKIAIWNPLSERYCEMLCPGLHSSIGLKPLIAFGFGYEKTTKDYKVVMLVNHFINRFWKTGNYQAWIYSLKLNTWKRLEKFSHAILRGEEYERNGVFCNNALHWIIEKEILRFDLVDEKFDKVALPTKLRAVRLSILDDRLCLTIRKNFAVGTECWGGIEIWVMNKDSLSWSIMINLVDDYNLQTFQRQYYWVKPVLYLVKREVIVFVGQGLYRETFFLYDLINHSTEILYVATKPEQSNYVEAFPYMETLEWCDPH